MLIRFVSIEFNGATVKVMLRVPNRDELNTAPSLVAITAVLIVAAGGVKPPTDNNE